MPLQQTSGNVTADAYGGGAAAVPNYIEDVFSTYLYTGNGSTQTITNGIDLAGKGGLTWFKRRDGAANHQLYDTVRGGSSAIFSDLNIAAQPYAQINSFNNNGVTINNSGSINTGSIPFVSWTFREQPKFFDVQTVSHTFGVDNTIDLSALGTVGCVIIKQIDGANNWYVWHRSLGNAYYGLFLNANGAPSNFGTAPVQVSGTTVTMTDSSAVGGYFSTGTYVVYAWAHNAGGFGLTGTDNVISCGSFTTNGSGGVTGDINLGYEAQWVMMKCTSTTSNWIMVDVMRGFSQTAFEELDANTSAAAVPVSGGAYLYPTATGFGVGNGTLNNSQTWIYIAIRRGPMKVPTDGTKVFTPQIYTGDGTSNRALTGFGFSPDLVIQQVRSNLTYNSAVADRLRGVNNTGSTIATPMLRTNTTEAEGYSGATQSDIQLLNMDGITVGPNSFSWSNGSGYNNALWNFRRAPGFFDEVCYTGTGSATTVAHNLGVTPELVITKRRSSSAYWAVLAPMLGTPNNTLALNATAAAFDGTSWWGSGSATGLTATTFGVGIVDENNASGSTYVAYLFASCPGVSKVGSYTGNGTTQTINCGFTGGARFVLIKRTDSTGDWYVYDTARGMTVLTDPYLLLNSTAAESATLGSVITTSVGFIVDATILAAVNTNGASYIFLAIA